MLALDGNEGCELLSRNEEKEKEDVVGSLKGNGMLPTQDQGCMPVLTMKSQLFSLQHMIKAQMTRYQ